MKKELGLSCISSNTNTSSFGKTYCGTLLIRDQTWVPLKVKIAVC